MNSIFDFFASKILKCLVLKRNIHQHQNIVKHGQHHHHNDAHLKAARLEVEVEHIFQIHVRRKALILLKVKTDIVHLIFKMVIMIRF